MEKNYRISHYNEIDNLIKSIDRSKKEGERNLAMLEVLYGCGLRVSELIELKVSEIYWKEGFGLLEKVIKKD